MIKSGDLAGHLNNIESSPWGDSRQGKGISANKLAAMFKPFKIRPRQGRDTLGTKARGYWLKDLEEVFKRYPPRSELGQAGQVSAGAGSRDPQSGTEEKSCPSSKLAETRTRTDLSQLSHSDRGDTSLPFEMYEEDL